MFVLKNEMTISGDVAVCSYYCWSTFWL